MYKYVVVSLKCVRYLRAFLDTSYDDIMASMDSHKELKTMTHRDGESVVFVYRGGEDTAMV